MDQPIMHISAVSVAQDTSQKLYVHGQLTYTHIVHPMIKLLCHLP